MPDEEWSVLKIYVLFATWRCICSCTVRNEGSAWRVSHATIVFWSKENGIAAFWRNYSLSLKILIAFLKLPEHKGQGRSLRCSKTVFRQRYINLKNWLPSPRQSKTDYEFPIGYADCTPDTRSVCPKDSPCGSFAFWLPQRSDRNFSTYWKRTDQGFFVAAEDVETLCIIISPHRWYHHQCPWSWGWL